ncbi:hypothetical protein [Streptomyces sp. NPDC020965]|uniref:hypothetical protein n=1 Tax=Streptomyces sp. NPDC020965 TaxID=3365105 RepID=UPI0037A118BA
MNLDYPDHNEPPIRAALTWPPCHCGSPICPDRPCPESTRDDSPVLRSLRERVREVNEQRKCLRGLW